MDQTQGSGKPMLKRTTTVTSKLPTGSRTVTQTNISEIKGCSSKGSKLPGPKTDCDVCPPGGAGARGQPSQIARGIPTPRALPTPRTGAGGGGQLQQPQPRRYLPTSAREGGGQPQQQQQQPRRYLPTSAPAQQPRAIAAGAGVGSGMTPCPARSGGARPTPAQQPRPVASGAGVGSGMTPCPARTGGKAARSQQVPPPADMGGEYFMPAQFGPRTVKGKGMSYSSPQDLRSRMEEKLPKELKYYGSKPPVGGRDRTLLQQPGAPQQLKDIMSGTFTVGAGQPQTEESIIDAADVSLMERTIDQEEAAELFNISGPNIMTVEAEVHEDLEGRYRTLHADSDVVTKGTRILQMARPTIQTPSGPQQLLQQSYFERRVERDDQAERVIKNMSVTDFDEATGEGTQVVLSQQRMSPQYTTKPDEREFVSLRDTVSVTDQYISTAKDVVISQTSAMVDIDPLEVAKLVEEEQEDVENTLKMVPPDLTLEPDRYAMKKRLQNLRLNSESVVLLEHSVVTPLPNPDQASNETPPEAIANIMHTIEIGVTPQCAPEQVFNTLFEEKPANERKVVVSPVSEGPLQDVVVPTEIAKEIHQESVSQEVNALAERKQNVPTAEEVPYVDIFKKYMGDGQISPQPVKTKDKSFKPGELDESVVWAHEDIEPVVNLVGAEPVEVLEPADVSVLDISGNLADELGHGIEYFVDAEPIQYISRVQLRGSQLPCWFPGYIMAMPEFPEVVKLARHPYEVLYSAWKATQPKIMPDESFVEAP